LRQCSNLSNIGITGLAERLHTSLDKGLNPGDFTEREEAFGSNYK